MTDNHMIINGERFPVINAWVEVESPSDGRRRWGIVTEPAAEVQPAPQPAAPSGATATDKRHPLMGVPLRDGIPEDVILSVTTPDGPVLQHTLIMAAILARTSGGGLLPFVYRDPYDPELPDAQRPLRRATLAIIDDRIADVQPAASEGFQMPDQLLEGFRGLLSTEAELADRMFGAGTAEKLEKRNVPIAPSEAALAQVPQGTLDVGKCLKCGTPFDPTDTRIAGGCSQEFPTPFCRACVSRCHDTEIADHWCAVDQWRQDQARQRQKLEERNDRG